MVDDDVDFRLSLEALLRASGWGLKLFASADAFLAAEKDLPPAVVLLDIRMPGTNGLRLVETTPDLATKHVIVVVTGHGDVDVAVRALKSGAVDFLEKPFRSGRLLEVVTLADAELVGRSKVASERNRAVALTRRLSPRERQIMELLAEGKPNKIVAHELGISVRTVEMHRAKLMSKLGVRSVASLASLALAACGAA